MLKLPKREVIEEDMSDWEVQPKASRAKTEEHWHEQKVKRLLTLYLRYSEQFLNSSVKKKSLWKRIGQTLGVDATICDRKFRNLKHRYIYLLKKKMQYNTCVKWPYFDLLEKINKNNRFNVKFSCKPIYQEHLNNRFYATNGEAIISGEQGKQERYDDTENIIEDVEERQNSMENMELKLDRLVQIMEESNDIQRERNELFQQYLRKIRT